MEGMSITKALIKQGCEPISAQTVPNTFSCINASSLLAEQVNNRSSAQWKKANFVICSKVKTISLNACIEGWKLLASSEGNQVLFLQGNDGVYKAYNWNGREIPGDLLDIIRTYRIN